MALSLALLAWLILKKKYRVSLIIILGGILFIFCQYGWLMNRFRFKIPVLTSLIKQIIQHPFVGSGFNHTLSPDNMVFIDSQQIWLWRYNDFLNLTSQLGLISLISCVGFCIVTLRRIKNDFNFFIAVMMILVMTAKSIMPFIDKAVTYILLTGLFIVFDYKKEEIKCG